MKDWTPPRTFFRHSIASVEWFPPAWSPPQVPQWPDGRGWLFDVGEVYPPRFKDMRATRKHGEMVVNKMDGELDGLTESETWWFDRLYWRILDWHRLTQ